mmetsp:Transcript_103167/g.178186  ORF Transcript_103167/g.178186 Transcript_103167/m.178186 type:complete len:1175 (-) Transcript_103167:76-3600(-)
MEIELEGWIELTLTHINEYRASHRVPPLSWSSECYEAALRQANYCSVVGVTEVGNLESAYGTYGQKVFRGNNVEDAIDQWYSEGQFYDFDKHGLSEKTQNFTQMVWKKTRKVGIALSNDGEVIVANYLPAGNQTGQFKKNVLPIDFHFDDGPRLEVDGGHLHGDAPLHALLCGLNLEVHEESILKVTQATTLDELLQRVESEDDLIGLLDHGMTQEDIGNVYQLIDEEKKATSLESVVEDMLLHVYEEDCQMTGIKTLRDATLSDPGISITIGQIGGIEAILHAMENHEGHSSLLECACSALHHVLHDLPVNQKMMRDDGGLEILLEAMERHMDCWEVQDQACLALASFMECNVENQTRFGNDGGVELVLRAMERHKLSAIVQESCCHVLSIALDHHSLNVSHVSKVDGLNKIVDCMKQHLQKADVQEQACSALHKALFSRPENKERFRQAGGMIAVLQAMNEHATNDHICESGAGALGLAILNHKENKTALGRKGGIEVLLDVMRKHGEHISVLHQACRTLNIAMISHKSNQELLRKLSGVEVICNAMVDHRDCPGIIDEGCGALGSIMFDGPNAEQPKTLEKLFCQVMLRNSSRGSGDADVICMRMANADGLRVVAQALKNFPARVGIQVWGCAALVVAAKGHPISKHRMVGCGAIETIIFNMQMHLDSPDVLVCAYVALATACSQADDECQSRMGNAGGIEAVIEGMSQHMDKAKLLERGCCALGRAVMQHPGNQSRMELAGGNRVIEAAMIHHFSNMGLQKQGAFALYNAFKDEMSELSCSYSLPRTASQTPRSGAASPAVCPSSPDLPTPRMILETPCAEKTTEDKGNQGHDVPVIGRICIYNRTLVSDAQKVEVENVLHEMNANYLDAGVQEKGCLSLRKALISNPENAELLCETSGVELVIRVMQKHHLVANILREGCWVLYVAMLTYPDCKGEVSRAGGIEVILQGMRQHMEDKVLQENCCATLAVATIHHMDNKNRMGEAGGLEAVIQAMQLHIESAGIQEQGCLALRSGMISHSANRASFGDAGGAEIVVEALRRYPWNQGVVAQGFWALYNAMLAHPENKSRVCATGGLETIIQAMRLNQSDVCIQESGCRALHCAMVRISPHGSMMPVTSAKDLARKWRNKTLKGAESSNLAAMLSRPESAEESDMDSEMDDSALAAMLAQS